METEVKWNPNPNPNAQDGNILSTLLNLKLWN